MECLIAGPGCLHTSHLVSMTTTDELSEHTTKVACIACATALVPVYSRPGFTILVQPLPTKPGDPVKVPESVGEKKVIHNGTITQFGAGWLRNNNITCPQCGLPFEPATFVTQQWGGYLFHSDKRNQYSSESDAACAKLYKQPFMARAEDLATRFMPHLNWDGNDLSSTRRQRLNNYTSSVDGLANALIKSQDEYNLEDQGMLTPEVIGSAMKRAAEAWYWYVASYLLTPQAAEAQMPDFLRVREQLREVPSGS